MPTPAEEAADAASAAAAFLAALADVGVPTHLVAKVRAAADGARGAVFFEAPLAAVKSLVNVLGMSGERPAEQRYRPFVAKSRLLTRADVVNAVGVGLPDEHYGVVHRLCDGANGGGGGGDDDGADGADDADATYAVIVSVALSCGTNVVRGASYAATRDEDAAAGFASVVATVDPIVIDPAAPSTWAMTPKSTPESPTKDEPWMWCLARGQKRADALPPFAYKELKPHPIMTPRNALHLRDVPAGVKKARSRSHWSPYDPVGVVNAVP